MKHCRLRTRSIIDCPILGDGLDSRIGLSQVCLPLLTLPGEKKALGRRLLELSGRFDSIRFDSTLTILRGSSTLIPRRQIRYHVVAIALCGCHSSHLARRLVCRKLAKLRRLRRRLFAIRLGRWLFPRLLAL